jgi:1-deoxy-D-xylulose-5-phosphate reductoisomerase
MRPVLSGTALVRQLAVLGATGSIGVSTLDVAARHPEKFAVTVLTANTRVSELFSQCQKFQPLYAVMACKQSATSLAALCREAGLKTEVLSGSKAISEVVAYECVDDVMAAIVGAAGLPACLAAADAGKRILLANKEALVMAGDVFMSAVKRGGASLLPIDSEHNAVFQCWPHQENAHQQIRRIVLTASGGPFRGLSRGQLESVTPDQACAHPNWAMGRKISVDSATMMNKGLEVIEACWLFDLPVSQVDVVVHPQSVSHSMVEYIDGSTLAQLGQPDMRTPIAHAMAWPDQRIDAGVSMLNLPAIGQLNFEEPDYDAFPCLALAKRAAEQGASAPAVLNAANEIAVDAFLTKQLSFLDIAGVVDATLQKMPITSIQTELEGILAVDMQARQIALNEISKRTH